MLINIIRENIKRKYYIIYSKSDVINILKSKLLILITVS